MIKEQKLIYCKNQDTIVQILYYLFYFLDAKKNVLKVFIYMFFFYLFIK